MDALIEGVSINPLKIIPVEHGDVLHALKATDSSFVGFGEAYFSTIEHGSIKGWKYHSKMTLNIVVPVGIIRFVIFDDRPESETRNTFNEIVLGPSSNYVRLTVKPKLWFAFQGLDKGLNLLLNLASIAHDPTEARTLPITNTHIPNYGWQ